MTLFERFDTAEFQQGGPAGFVRRHAESEIVVNVQLQMAIDFGGEIGVALSFLRKKPAARISQARSFSSGSLRTKKRATIAVVCAHSRASFPSCFLPARVSLRIRAAVIVREAPFRRDVALFLEL